MAKKAGGTPRAVVEVRVERGRAATGATLWLDADGGSTEDRDAAALFRLHRSPTMAERTRIEMRAHDQAGGLDAWVDIRLGLDGAAFLVREKIHAELWPDGVPAEFTPDDVKRVQDAWHADRSALVERWRHLVNLHERIWMLAGWAVVAVSVPPGWEDLSEREDEATVSEVIDAWSAALGVAMRGKTQPSAS